jgi:hypothetical protein
MSGKAAKVTISERQQECLQRLARDRDRVHGLAQRAQMILLAFEKWDNAEIAARLGCERHSVGVWRRRWAKAFHRLVVIECMESATAFSKALADVLSDRPPKSGVVFERAYTTERELVSCHS